MKIFDEMTAKLETLNREVAAAPARLDAIEAAKAAGLKAPEGGTWATIDDLDASLNSAFSPDGKPLEPLMWEKRVALKRDILAAGLVAEPERPNTATSQGAVRYALRLLKQHGVALPQDNKMFVPGDIAAMKISPEQKIELKVALEKAGLLDMGTVVVKASAPKANREAADLIFAELEIPPQKLHVNALSAFMTQRGIATGRRMQMKEILGSCGYLIF
jgi:hypothetical protein